MALFPLAVFATNSGGGRSSVSRDQGGDGDSLPMNDTISNLYDYIPTIPQEKDGKTVEEAEKIRDGIVEYLKEHRDELADDPTVKGGYKLIDAAIASIDGDEGIAQTWKPMFKEQALALGVEFESVHNTISLDDGSSFTITDNKKANGDFVDAAVKVNILTWNNTEVGGETVANHNRGVVQDLIKALDSNSSFVSGFTDPLKGVAMALTIAFGAYGLIMLSMEKSVTGEAVTREFIKMVIGLFVIYNFRTIALALISFGTWMLQALQTSLGSMDYQASSVEYALLSSFSNLTETSLLSSLAESVFTGAVNLIKDAATGATQGLSEIMGSFGNGIIQVASSLAVYSVAIELAVRYAVTPIAIADLYSEKFRSSGIAWLKKLLACVITGTIMYLIIYITDVFKNVLGANFSVITNTAINLTMIGMLFRARQIANEVVGAH